MDKQQVKTAEPQEKPATPLQAFNRLLTNEATQKYLTQILYERKSTFVSNLVALVSNNKQLQLCDAQTILFAGLKATALNLPLDQNLGFCYIIPYGNVAQFQMGWKGFYQLAIRSNKYKTINVRDIRQGEIVGEDFISGEYLFQSLPLETRWQAPIIGYLAFFELFPPSGSSFGFRKSLFMTVNEIQSHAQTYSKTYKKGPWQTDFDAMARKTVLKLLLARFGVISVETAEVQNAINSDQAVITNGKLTYTDNTGETIEDPNADVADLDQQVIFDTEEATARASTAADAAKVISQAK